jgi:hypothetical protein
MAANEDKQDKDVQDTKHPTGTHPPPGSAETPTSERDPDADEPAFVGGLNATQRRIARELAEEQSKQRRR